MKKFNYLLFVTLLFFVLASCNNDKSSNTDLLYKVWQLTSSTEIYTNLTTGSGEEYTEHLGNNEIDVWSFDKSGVFIRWWIKPGDEGENSGEWIWKNKNEKVIWLRYKSGYTMELKIKKLTNDKLELYEEEEDLENNEKRETIYALTLYKGEKPKL